MKRRVTIILVAFIFYVIGMVNFATNNLFTMLKIYLFLPFVLFCNLFVAQKNSNKIVVGVVVDQMCYDYLYRFHGKFGKGGFNKLIKQGANLSKIRKKMKNRKNKKKCKRIKSKSK